MTRTTCTIIDVDAQKILLAPTLNDEIMKVQKFFPRLQAIMPGCGILKNFLKEASCVLVSRGHMPLLMVKRAHAILSRLRLLTIGLCIITLVWVMVDRYVFNIGISSGLTHARLLASASFFFLYLYLKNANSMEQAWCGIGIFFFIPTLLYLHVSSFFEAHVLEESLRQAVIAHLFFPFLLIAGISIFPLTTLESVLISILIFSAKTWADLMYAQTFDHHLVVGEMWLLLLLSTISVLSNASQLRFIISLVKQTIRDPLTQCFSRQNGEELLAVQYNLSLRYDRPLTLAFIDLDYFKGINDQYGHTAGNEMLQQVVEILHRQSRSSDMLVRWGGEEFVLIMPQVNLTQSLSAFERIRQFGFGLRPDGQAQTVSIGLAERKSDRAGSWQDLINIADMRMYVAKQNGRNKIVSCGLVRMPKALHASDKTVDGKLQ
jgi:diguanylate cyclase (GGDEF)-like protein